MTGITKEALNYLLADEDSDLSSLSSDSDSSQSEFEEEDLQPLAKIRVRQEEVELSKKKLKQKNKQSPIDSSVDTSCEKSRVLRKSKILKNAAKSVLGIKFEKNLGMNARTVPIIQVYARHLVSNCVIASKDPYKKIN